MLIFIICIIILFTHVDRWNIRIAYPRAKKLFHTLTTGVHGPHGSALGGGGSSGGGSSSSSSLLVAAAVCALILLETSALYKSFTYLLI